ncbi:MAG TPA: hypothetical protein DCR48_11515 [Flavobacteriales bacterium]|nr:hypothetical protein [Flavobacteriales bacterium]
MWIPSLNAIGLIVIGIGTLLTVLFKKRKTDTTEVTVLGEKNRMQLSRSRVTLLFASALIAAGSILSYFEYQKEIGYRNISIIDNYLRIVQSNPNGVSLSLVVTNMEKELNLSVLNKQINSEIAQSEKSNDITAITDLDSRASSVLFKLFKIYKGSDSYSKADALFSRYSEYFIRSVGGEDNFQRWKIKQESFRVRRDIYHTPLIDPVK